MKQGYYFLTNIGLEPYLYINRIREIRKIDIAKVYLDKLELLGDFVEFELEDGHEFNELADYLKEIGIETEPEMLYGDIFKEKVKDLGFKENMSEAIKCFLK